MLASIKLDNKPSLEASKIDDVWAYRYLPAEAVAADLLPTQADPQPKFNLGHLPS